MKCLLTNLTVSLILSLVIGQICFTWLVFIHSCRNALGSWMRNVWYLSFERNAMAFAVIQLADDSVILKCWMSITDNENLMGLNVRSVKGGKTMWGMSHCLRDTWKMVNQATWIMNRFTFFFFATISWTTIWH